MRRTVALIVFMAFGCATGAPQNVAQPSILYHDLADAERRHGVLAILVFETGRSPADDAARAAFEQTMGRIVQAASEVKLAHTPAAGALLDLKVSANRAAAARYHVGDVPTLLLVSDSGLIVSRDTDDLAEESMARSVGAAVQSAEPLEARLENLREAVRSAPEDSDRRQRLADFLVTHGNSRDAIPHYKALADNKSIDLALRVRAWTEMGRAHLWIGEPEKGRYSAQALIDTLGPSTPDAIAGGNLVRGIQDYNAKRYDRSRLEFEAAVAASPKSNYAAEAAAGLVKLPAQEK